MTDLNVLTGTWTIDPAHSRLGFVTRHAMVAKVRGSFADFTGDATVDGADLANSSVSVTAKAASFESGQAQRDEHVRGADFLDAENFADVTFVSTKVEQTGATTADITGDLTIKGTTKSLTIPFEFLGTATDPFGNERAGFEGTTVIDRNEYGITFNAPLGTGGVLVGDKVTLEIEISAIKQA